MTPFENGTNKQPLIILNFAQMCQGSGEDCQSKQLHGHCIRFTTIFLKLQSKYNVLDFRFYEDQADDLRETDEGTLLPLWKFLFEKVS